MSSRNRPSAKSRDDARSEVIAATIDLLVREGIAGATFRRVAAAAGLSAGAVQHHFPTRLQLLCETLDEIFLDLGRRLVSFEFSPDVEDRTQEIIEVLWGFYGGRNYMAAQEILLGSRLNLDNEDIIQRRSYREMDQLFRDAWGRIVEGSAIDAEAGYPLLRLLLSAMRGMAIIAIHRRRANFADMQLSILAGLTRDALISGRIPAAGNFTLEAGQVGRINARNVRSHESDAKRSSDAADVFFPL